LDTSARPLVYRMQDAAITLGISRSKLYQLIADGQLVKLRLGGRSVIQTDELERYVRYCSEESAKNDAQSSVSARRCSRASPRR
jgi:excisionase family DNA binding protein